MSNAQERSARAFRAVEYLLAHAHPKQDLSDVTQKLEDRFVSAEAMFSAGAHLLEKNGLQAGDALLLSKVPELSRYVAHQSYRKKPLLNRLGLAAEYLKTNYEGLKVERFYLLCLDAHGRLMENVLLQEGTLDSALFNLKHLLAELMRVEPGAAVVSHNHPGHTLRPSQDDIDCTQEIIRALGVVGIPLLDHIIIAGREAVSLRENGFVSASAWLSQAPESRLLREWLESVPGSGA